MDKGRYGAKAREARSIGTGKSGSWSDKARNGVEIKGGQRRRARKYRLLENDEVSVHWRERDTYTSDRCRALFRGCRVSSLSNR